jgi:hypothetical protein
VPEVTDVLSRLPQPDGAVLYLFGLMFPGVPLLAFSLYFWLKSWIDAAKGMNHALRCVPGVIGRFRGQPAMRKAEILAMPLLLVCTCILWVATTFAECSYFSTYFISQNSPNQEIISTSDFGVNRIWSSWNPLSEVVVCAAIVGLLLTFISRSEGVAALFVLITGAPAVLLAIFMGFLALMSLMEAVLYGASWSNFFLSVIVVAGAALYVGSSVAGLSAAQRLGEIARDLGATRR